MIDGLRYNHRPEMDFYCTRTLHRPHELSERVFTDQLRHDLWQNNPENFGFCRFPSHSTASRTYRARGMFTPYKGFMNENDST